jgi:hypothetical protein
VRGATLQILATSPVVRTSFTLLLVVVVLIGAFLRNPKGFFARRLVVANTIYIGRADDAFRPVAHILPTGAGTLVAAILLDGTGRCGRQQRWLDGSEGANEAPYPTGSDSYSASALDSQILSPPSAAGR